ncbi:MAG: hypothetical protein WCQ57_01345 [Verrucomicrobiota bacterium]
MIELRTLLALGIACAVAACASPKTFAPDQAPEYVIIRDYTPFFRLSPMQQNGPDASLPVQTRVKLLSQDMGYSQVLLEDQRTGYVANEYMALAPPRPPEPRESVGSSDGSASARSGNRKRGSRYRGEQVNDTPLPDVNVPPPDLNIAPEEVPAAVPAPPPEKPKFRF